MIPDWGIWWLRSDFIASILSRYFVANEKIKPVCSAINNIFLEWIDEWPISLEGNSGASLKKLLQIDNMSGPAIANESNQEAVENDGQQIVLGFEKIDILQPYF